jgi:putative transcriptional regulator
MSKEAPRTRLDEAILETADDMRRLGLMDGATHAKITLRHLSSSPCPTTEPITAEEIRELRERAHLSHRPSSPAI